MRVAPQHLPPGAVVTVRLLTRGGSVGVSRAAWVVSGSSTRVVVLEAGSRRLRTLCAPAELDEVRLASREIRERIGKPPREWVRMTARESRRGPDSH